MTTEVVVETPSPHKYALQPGETCVQTLKINSAGIFVAKTAAAHVGNTHVNQQTLDQRAQTICKKVSEELHWHS